MDKNTSIIESVKASYRGRIPTRADGKKRRRALLDAVRNIIIKHGAQGVKHRAVAEEAQVPLAATTYYFPDIQALLHDAFLDFCEININHLQTLELKSRELLATFKNQDVSIQDDGLQTQKKLAQIIHGHVLAQVNSKDDRIIERAFRNESIRNPELSFLVNAMEVAQLNAIARFFQELGSDDPNSDGRELIAIILYLEHSLLAGYVEQADAKSTINRFLARILDNG